MIRQNKLQLLRSILLLLTVVLLPSCASHRATTADSRQSATLVSYKTLTHYYFNSDAQIPDDPVITTQRDFDRLYGAATFMGKGGQPEPVDFGKESVIGIILPLTNDHREVILGPLEKRGRTMRLHYKVVTHERNTPSTMRPMALIKVSRSDMGKRCVLVED